MKGLTGRDIIFIVFMFLVIQGLMWGYNREIKQELIKIHTECTR